MENVRHKIRAYLYDNLLTQDNPNDFIARVSSERSLNAKEVCTSAVARSTAGTATIARSTVINDGSTGSNQSESFVGGEYAYSYPYACDIVANNSWVIDLTTATGNTTIYFYQRDRWGYLNSTTTTTTACCQDQYSAVAFKMQ